MYSSKVSVNILTALLVKHGIRYAVVCPGSRNAPIVHNLYACRQITCLPVTDERSAGFYALGMAQATDSPVAVVVTSGSALLNVAPAVAEAHYQHQSLVIISADRPAAWIDQLDGQTLQQPGVLQRWVARSVTLPEPQNASDEDFDLNSWHCNRLVNEALLEATSDYRACVHINVPLTEPLFNMSVPNLPEERMITRFSPAVDYDCLPADFVNVFLNAERPMIVFGQMSPKRFSSDMAGFLFDHVIVLHEALAPFGGISHFDEVLSCTEWLPAEPDVVLYVGDCIVSKRLKTYLRQADNIHVWRVSQTGQVEDTFQNLCGVIVGDVEMVLSALSNKMSRYPMHGMSYRRQWLQLLNRAREHALNYVPGYSQMAAVKAFEEMIDVQGLDAVAVHYANSTAVRLANIYARHHVWCNRGVNGIEGSLSTVCGFAEIVEHDEEHTLKRVYCVIGDLSFFYDQNALWHEGLSSKLRILLLNNGCGGIFGMVKGLGGTSACSSYVMGSHHSTAEGICRQYGIGYRQASDSDAMDDGLSWLTTEESEKPLLLEVLTDADVDVKVFEDYYRSACK